MWQGSLVFSCHVFVEFLNLGPLTFMWSAFSDLLLDLRRPGGLLAEEKERRWWLDQMRVSILIAGGSEALRLG
jgi:hypothetical protein